MNEEVSTWGDTVITAMTAMWIKIAGFIPQLIAAAIILVVGYFIAKAIGFVLGNGLKRIGFDKLSEQVGVSDTLSRSGISMSSAEIVGRLGFWIIMLTFLVTATESLGLPRVSATIDEFVMYLPRVIAAAVIIIVGLLVAHFARDVVRSGAESIGVEYAKPLGTTVYGILFIIVVSLAINALEIETDLLNAVISILFGAIGIAVALSLGLGTRDLANNITAGVYVRDLFEAGDKLVFGETEGIVEEVGTVKTIVRHEDGSTTNIANTDLLTFSVRVIR